VTRGICEYEVRTNTMKYWITTDTHFGHKMLLDNGHREEGFEKRILRALEDVQNFSKPPSDILIHLGDFCIGEDEKWQEEFRKHTMHFKKKILIRGNHDNKSYNWYYNHGWDFVCETMRLRAFGKELLFSHMPVLAEDSEFTTYHKVDMNIHGHLHGKGKYSHRAVEGYNAGFHYDCAPDNHDMKPVSLENICK